MSVKKIAPLILLLGLCVLVGCKETNADPQSLTRAPLIVEMPDGRTVTINVELATTPEQQQKGLMFREEMADDTGMLFIFDTPREIGFWMKNTLIPLDMIFIAPTSGIIHKIHRNAIPHDKRSIPSNGITKAVLEINAGLSDRLGIVEGSKIIFPDGAQ